MKFSGGFGTQKPAEDCEIPSTIGEKGHNLEGQVSRNHGGLKREEVKSRGGFKKPGRGEKLSRKSQGKFCYILKGEDTTSLEGKWK